MSVHCWFNVAQVLLSTGPSAGDIYIFCENQGKKVAKPLDLNSGQQVLLGSLVLWSDHSTMKTSMRETDCSSNDWVQLSAMTRSFKRHTQHLVLELM